ncbi:MAG: O-antigen ligase family protein, partial [Verrucomicrobiota bacterium]
LAAVVLVTAKMTGGFGLRSMGSDVYGGKKYIYLLAAIASYFVLTSRAIPVERAHLYVGLFFIGGATSFIGDLFPITPKALHFIFWFFPPYSSTDQFEVGVTRLRGTGAAAFAVYCWMMARYGLRGIFLSGKFWRLGLFLVILPASMLGGFRSTMLAIAMIFSLQFYLEGLHRTKLLPVFALLGLVGAVAVVPLAPHLPFTLQRALAFLPLDISPAARFDAEDSSKWRIDMWEALLPQVPQHLLLGKGLAITQQDYQMMGNDVSFKAFDSSEQGLALAFDYHNGPLSTIIPFGIWGMLAFCWFIAAALWALWRNYRFGDPALRIINIFLLAVFTERVIMFFVIFGGLSSDMVSFAGLIGLSIALNRGVSKRVVEPVVVEEQSGGVALPLHRRPSFQR